MIHSQEWSLLLENAADAMISIGTDGLITSFNREASRILGYTADELIGKHTPLLLHDPIEISSRQDELRPEFGNAVEGMGVFIAPLAQKHRDEREWSYVHKDGHTFPVRLAVSRIPDAEGNTLGFLGVAREISELKKTEKALRESEERFRAFFSMSPYSMAIIRSKDRVHLDVNEAFVKDSGYTREELVGHSSNEFDHMANPEELTQMIQLVRRDGYLSNFEYHHKCRDGEIRNKLFSMYPLTYEGEKVYASIDIDVTAERQAEAERRESEKLFHDIFEVSPYAMSITSLAEGVFLEVNKAYQELTGLRKEDLIGQSIMSYNWFESNAERDSVVALIKEQGFLSNYKHRAIMPDGRQQYHLLSIYPVTWLGRACSVSIVIDVTPQQKAEDEIRQLNNELESMVSKRTLELEKSMQSLATSQEQLIQSERLAALGQLSAGVAHELNTPLGVILSASRESEEMLGQEFPSLISALCKLDSANREFIFKLSSMSSVGLQGVTEALNRQSRKELTWTLAERGIPHAESVAEILLELGLRWLVDESSQWLRKADSHASLEILRTLSTLRRLGHIQSEAATKASHVLGALRSYLRQEDGAESSVVFIGDEIATVLTLFHNRIKHGIEIKFNVDPTLQILGPRQQINQVWINLINNALQAMPEDGTLSISARAEESLILVDIQDNGCGIPVEIQQRVFEPFFTTKKKGEGIGLGLDICRRIIEKCNGKIHFTSRPGATCFTVELPRFFSENT